jgi:hypothetical protein
MGGNLRRTDQTMRPFSPRPTRFLRVQEHQGWRIKLYAISLDEAPLLVTDFAPGLALALESLPSPALTALRPGLGFCVLHRGRGADYAVLGWWDRENELPVRVLVRPHDEPVWRAARGSESFCVWDLEVVAFERDAYVKTVLARPPLGAQEYLNRTFVGGEDSSVPAPTLTDDDFASVSWHECALWGIDLRVGDPDDGDWTSDLALDIDFIAEWICGVDGGAQFRVAPATLVFHGVTDPRIAIDWGRSGHQIAVHPPSIDQIERWPLDDQRVYLDRPYYRWTIRLNWPDESEISFGAFGFTQVLRATPVLSGNQSLSLKARRQMQLDAGR